MVSLYSEADADLWEKTSKVLYSCLPQGDDGLEVINVKTIDSVVAMIPHPHVQDAVWQRRLEGRVFVVEKLGLDVFTLSGPVQDIDADDDE